MFPETLYIVKGTDKPFPRQIMQQDGRTPSTQYQATDELTCRVWTGDETNIVATPVVSWTDYTVAAFVIYGAASDTVDLAVGLYNCQVLVYRPSTGQKSVIFNGGLQVDIAPGLTSIVNTPIYCQYQDVLDIAPWVETVASLRSDTTGFITQRGTARNWFDWLIVRNMKSAGVGRFGAHSWSAMNWAYGTGMRKTIMPNRTLIQWLAEDKLIVRPDVVRVNALRTAGEIGMSQIGNSNQWASLGSMCIEMSENEVLQITAEIDPQNIGVGAYLVELGQGNTLYS